MFEFSMAYTYHIIALKMLYIQNNSVYILLEGVLLLIYNMFHLKYFQELGLYYHTDTECYYYYSEDKKEFVFHSYPDRSALAANASLIAHEKRKARKHKKVYRCHLILPQSFISRID